MVIPLSSTQDSKIEPHTYSYGRKSKALLRGNVAWMVCSEILPPESLFIITALHVLFVILKTKLEETLVWGIYSKDCSCIPELTPFLK